MTLTMTFDHMFKNINLCNNVKPLELVLFYLAYILNIWNLFKLCQVKWPCDLHRDIYAKNSHFGIGCRWGILFHKHMFNKVMMALLSIWHAWCLLKCLCTYADYGLKLDLWPTLNQVQGQNNCLHGGFLLWIGSISSKPSLIKYSNSACIMLVTRRLKLCVIMTSTLTFDLLRTNFKVK